MPSHLSPVSPGAAHSRKPYLCLGPQNLFDDGRVLASECRPLVDGLAPVDPVGKHQIKSSAREWLATIGAAVCRRALLADKTGGIELRLKRRTDLSSA